MPPNRPSSSPASTICPTCFSLDMRRIPQPHKDMNICTYGEVSRHWIRSDELANDPSCKSCRFLKSVFDTLLHSGEIVEVPPGKQIEYRIAIMDRDDDHSADEVTALRMRQAALKKGASRSLKIEMRCETSPGPREEFQVEIYTPPGATPAPWECIGTAGEVPTKPSAAECGTIITSWLDHCNKEHTLCQTSRAANHRSTLLPRRVLDISNEQIRLIESVAGQRGHYVALSHCWGNVQPLITTWETIPERMRGIGMERLPKTFQDAIAITRSMGLQYIWIDSLCIIQGDKADWEQQSAVMADIYAGCYLNIVATRSAGGHEGCLEARWTEGISKTRKREVKSFKVPGVEEDIRIRLMLNSSHQTLQSERWIRQHSKTAPLLQRGWVYQERSLAPRSVHLHANEMIWGCMVEQRCECRELDGKPFGGDGWSASKDRIATLGALGDQKALHGLWRTIVEDFSLLDLTYESDRLPALSGLASRFAEYFPKNDRYMAGLWESDLARGLLWKARHEGTKQVTATTEGKKPTAPSWSWASLLHGCEDWEEETKPKLARWAPTTTYEQDRRVRIVSASVETDGQNKYGTVLSGSIKIEGAICAVIVGTSSAHIDNARAGNGSSGDSPDSAEWVTSHSLDPPPPPASFSEIHTVQYGTFNSLHLEYDTPTSRASADGTVYCLFIGTFIEVNDDDRHPHIRHCGLILRPAAGGKFERIGRWKHMIEDWAHNKDVWTGRSGILEVEII